MNALLHAWTAGYEHLSAWADVLDSINVFPVADGDTGTNLRVSLAPLRGWTGDVEPVRHRLARSATGNSGNIAAAFFRELCQAQQPGELVDHVLSGRDEAYQAVTRPREGTMLSLFDVLGTALQTYPLDQEQLPQIMHLLQQAVLETSTVLAELAQAGVVDAGALGMYVFFDGFFSQLLECGEKRPDIVDLFAGRLAIHPAFATRPVDEHCIGAVLKPNVEGEDAAQQIAALGESVVILPDQEGLKVHLHGREPAKIYSQLQQLGEVRSWSTERITQELRPAATGASSSLHIVTDAAGSMTRTMARTYGITLLDSYIVTDGEARPESLCSPEVVYDRLKNGCKVTTAQASMAERHQYYQRFVSAFPLTLYLCVGSAFTGNYDTAVAWQGQHDPEHRFVILDTGAASGRLALIALLTARFAQRGAAAREVIDHAENLIRGCRECVFIDELKYLVAGGRVSRVKGFLGDLLHVKPIITPTAAGVQKLGTAKDREDQLQFALRQLAPLATGGNRMLLLLQYADNESWVREQGTGAMRGLLPDAEIIYAPLSLTSGVHMGPDTWSLAFAPLPQGE